MIPVYKIIFSLLLGLIYFIKTTRASTAVWVSLGVLGTALITGSWNTSYFVSTKCPAWYGLEAIANAPGNPAWTNWGCFGAVMGVAIERALGAGCLAVSGKHGFQTVDTIVDVDDAGDPLRKRNDDPGALSTHYVANLTTSLIVSGPDHADLTSLIGTSLRANQKRGIDGMILTSAGHLVPQNLTMIIDGVLHLPANYTSYPYGMTYDLDNGHSLIVEALYSDPSTIHNRVIQGPANETSLHKRFGEVDWVSLEVAAVTAGVCDWEVIGWDFAAAGNLDFWTALAEATGEELDGTVVFPAKKCVSLWTSRDSPRDDLLEAEMYINTWGGFDGDCVVGSQG